MKKQVIVILSLVLLVAITLGAYLFVRNNNQEKQKKESEDAAALQLVDFNSSNIRCTYFNIRHISMSFTTRRDLHLSNVSFFC